jgi:AraC-like DNA-binding protein
MFEPVNPDYSRSPAIVLKGYLKGEGDGPWHAHTKAELLCPSDRVVTVITEEGMWVTPPQRAVWILPGVKHTITCPTSFTLLALYCAPELTPRREKCCVVTMDALMRELMEAAAIFGDGYDQNGPEARLMAVLLDHLGILPVAPLSLTYPKDERAQKLARRMSADISSADSIARLASECGFSARTATRIFIEETGLPPAQWRGQLRILEAMRRLGRGESVTTVALESGYQDASSFISFFKKSTGQTPARFSKI